MKSKIEFIIIAICIIAVSIYFSDNAKSFFLDGAGSIVKLYENASQAAKNKFSEHVAQSEEIKALRAQNLELERSAALASTFAYELNGFLSERNSTSFSPNLQMVRTLTYVNIGDYNKIWLDFPDFNSSQIYGLIKNGKTAGIVVNNDSRPMAVLQNDPNCIFSVYIGPEKIAGIAKGNYKNIEIKYIYEWLEPKIGDEVFTSGLDGVFFGGISVGKIVEIKEQDLYKSAIVEPSNKSSVPTYLYIVTKDK